VWMRKNRNHASCRTWPAIWSHFLLNRWDVGWRRQTVCFETAPFSPVIEISNLPLLLLTFINRVP
jgi:hypothetical protein